MATVIFYEKPGCINNTKQKALLAAAGHTVQAHNLLSEPWTPEKLRLFFGQRPIQEWFNPSAPRIKSGEVMPTQLNEAQALALMIEDPLLIRRPLIQVDQRYEVGFDPSTVDTWLNLNSPAASQDLETCPRTSAKSSCS